MLRHIFFNFYDFFLSYFLVLVYARGLILCELQLKKSREDQGKAIKEIPSKFSKFSGLAQPSGLFQPRLLLEYE